MTPSPPIRLVLAQFRPRKGAVDENLARIVELVARVGPDADLVVFPETALSGYFVEGGVTEVARTSAQVARGLGAPPPDAPDLVLGCYEADGSAIRNSALYLTPAGDRWEVVHRHRKVFLPTYGVFDEARFVQAGREVRAFDTRFGRIGLLVCEDMFHRLPPTILALDGAELLIALAASPVRGFPRGTGMPANLERWDVVGRGIALELGVHFVVAHLVGSEGGKVLGGGSVVYEPGGDVAHRASFFREEEVAWSVDPALGHRVRRRFPLLEDLRVQLPLLRRELARVTEGPSSVVEPEPVRGGADPEEGGGARRGPPASLRRLARAPLEIDGPLLEEALVSFLRDEIVVRRGFSDVVVGVSGGVDSAVTLLLAARALGAPHVHAFLLPYATSAPESLEHGRLVCDAAGVESRTIEITGAVDAYVNAEEPEMSALRRGNLAARMRTLVLFDQSARLDALPLGTGNKSERLLGYFTWHADDAPPINPIGDLFKTQVIELARHLGVPEPILAKPPSADLVPGVHDADELGITYAEADPILHWLLDDVPPEDLLQAGFDPDLVHLVRERLAGTHWKRRPPTVALLSSSGIGEFYLRPVDY